MTKLRATLFAVSVVVGVISGVLVASGQGQRSPATLDDLLAEIRGLRADLSQSSGRSIQAQLLTARLSAQEGRIATLSRELSDVRQRMSTGQMTFAQLKPFLDQDGKVPEPFRAMVERMQSSDVSLRTQEAELTALIATEQNRWLEFNSRLDDLERALTR